MSREEEQGAAAVELRAAGTDLSERRRSGVSRGPLIDLPAAVGSAIAWSADGGGRIGAAATVAAIAAEPRIAAGYPGLAAAAAGLATPQIRAVATLGGNLAQRSRCWYYRNPHVACFKKGARSCPARSGNHLHGVIFDLGPCVAPHPSTLAAALLAYEAVVTTDRRSRLSIGALLGDGSEGSADHALGPGEMITGIDLPPPLPGERARYRRAILRAQAEWPLVEVVARLAVAGEAIALARLTAGGVAPVPIRLAAAEAALEGAAVGTAVIARAAAAATAGARPLPATGYKLALLEGLLCDVLERMLLEA
jgi:xanthine dehydrogenase YagS FAD-binding subunit